VLGAHTHQWIQVWSGLKPTTCIPQSWLEGSNHCASLAKYSTLLFRHVKQPNCTPCTNSPHQRDHRWGVTEIHTMWAGDPQNIPLSSRRYAGAPAKAQQAQPFQQIDTTVYATLSRNGMSIMPKIKISYPSVQSSQQFTWVICRTSVV